VREWELGKLLLVIWRAQMEVAQQLWRRYMINKQGKRYRRWEEDTKDIRRKMRFW